MSWTCPTCGSNNSCWSPSIFGGAGPRFGRDTPRDIVLESASQGIVNALAALAEPVPEMARKITYFEASPSANAKCQERWKELNDYVRLTKTTLEARRASSNSIAEDIKAEALRTLAGAVLKFAPDLAKELAGRWGAAQHETSKAAEDFLAFLRNYEPSAGTNDAAP